jgi:hypothetical protein
VDAGFPGYRVIVSGLETLLTIAQLLLFIGACGIVVRVVLRWVDAFREPAGASRRSGTKVIGEEVHRLRPHR